MGQEGEHRVVECVLAGPTTTYHALSRLPNRLSAAPATSACPAP
ncbi:MAG: hypothetical protein ACJ8BW_08485 [Ktedonobacteraceae bacterium]